MTAITQDQLISFFNDNNFEHRSDALKYIVDIYGRDKNLIQPIKSKRSSNIICLKCDDLKCGFIINCYKPQKLNVTNIFKFVENKSCLIHGQIDLETKEVITFCSGFKHLTAIELSSNKLFRAARSTQTIQKRVSKDVISTSLMRSIIASEGTNTKITSNVIKNASQLVKISALEHLNGFEKLSPFLKLLKDLNPGFQYKIDKDSDNNFYKRVAILFPYSVHSIKYCYKIFGVDSAFLDGIEIPKIQIPELQAVVEGLPSDLRIMFQRGHISALTGRTYNNEMIVFAVCVNHGETIESYDFFFKFVIEDCKMDIDQPDNTVITDRGSSILASLKKNIKKAFKRPCPKHISDNLISDLHLGKNDPLISLYWKASKAKSLGDYCSIVDIIETKHRGIEMMSYLNKIENWPLYMAIERGNILYETNSDNLVEIFFKAYGTPFFVLGQIIYKNMIRINDLQKSLITPDTRGLTDWAIKVYLQNNLAVNNITYEIIPSSGNNRTRSANVHSLDDRRIRVNMYFVDLQRKTCSCLHWQQSGVPCYHAIAFNRTLATSGFSKDDFYPFCHLDKMIEMFNDSDLFTTIFPTEGEIKTLIIESSNDDIHTVTPCIVEVNAGNIDSIVSSKRFPSKGEGNVRGTRQKPIVVSCDTCGKVIHKRTVHPPSACFKFLKKKNNPAAFITELK